MNRRPLWADDVESAAWPAGEDHQLLKHNIGEVYDHENTKAHPEAVANAIKDS
jgi:hypothetical protein